MQNTPDRSRFNSLTLVFLLFLAVLAGCASTPPESAKPPAVHQPVLDIAVLELGTPYRDGGSTPLGFD